MDINFFYPSEESLGIELLSAIARKEGASVSLTFDPGIFSDSYFNWKFLSSVSKIISPFPDETALFHPDLFAFSLVSEALPWARKKALYLKNKYPHIPIIAGGIHVISDPESMCRETWPDILCVGEGEVAFAEFIKKFSDYRLGNHLNIKSLWFRTNNGWKRNPLPESVVNLDKLPFPDKTLFYSKCPGMAKVFQTIFSRGCHYNCTFCANSFLQAKYPKAPKVRRVSPALAVKQIEKNINTYHPKWAIYLDDDLMASEEWLSEFTDRLQKIEKLPFQAFATPDSITSKKLKILKKAGCIRLGIGVQRAEEKIREKLLGRNGTNREIIEKLRLIKAEGIELSVDHMALPGESLKMLDRTARFYTYINPDSVVFNFLRAYPGTPMRVIAANQGWKLISLDNKTNSSSIASGGDLYPDDIKIQLPLLTYLGFMPLMPLKIRKWWLENSLHLKVGLPDVSLAKSIPKLIILTFTSSLDICDRQTLYKYFSLLNKIFRTVLNTFSSKYN